ERGDNPRHLIANTYVKRGEILDRNNLTLAETLGDIGSFNRSYPYPSLSNSIGYIDQKYGLFGLEKAYDDYLSGLKGYPASSIWLNYLLYDQPPIGRAIRLTLDLKLQQKVDDLLQNDQGAAVVLDASNGNILAIATQPFFDANELEENWAAWNSSENAPFLNRASQGAYPVGGLLSPLFLLEQDLDSISFFQDPQIFGNEEFDIQCISQFSNLDTDEQSAIKNGCLSAASQLIAKINLADIFESSVFEPIYNPLANGLPTNLPIAMSKFQDLHDLISGDNQIRISPLQIAASLAPLSNGGIMVYPSLVSSVNVSSGQWVLTPVQEGSPVTTPEKAKEVAEFLASDLIPGWEISAVTYDLDNAFSWYVMGTHDEWNKTPIIIALVLETENRNHAQTIGREIFKAINQ
ncbi:MAG: penicillin-binding transpeptidase domain-containing protein, partial [Pelolinea sp.]|nr:penicillin-binding transpeptidase domain-containing protein [Pelolinea sp.]